MTSSTHLTFISYAREDVAVARELHDWLSAHGQHPWIDLFDIPAGRRWPDAIDNALRSSAVVIGLMSPASVASENVKNEWDWAIANSRRLILLLIEPCEIPFHYVSRNHLDFTEDREAGYRHLAQQLTSPGNEAVVREPKEQVLEVEGRRVVGRARERAQLAALLDQAIVDTGSLVLISGEAGIGKTTLIETMASEAARQSMLVLSGGCYDLTTTPPYGPWVEMLRGYPASPGLPPVPLQLRERADLEQTGSQEQLFRIIAGFLAEIAAARPLLLVLEDLHWSDLASIELLRYIGRQLAGQRILLLASYRDDELTRSHALFTLLPMLVRESRAERLELQPLDAEALGALVESQYPLSDQDARTLGKYLLRRTEGNPLFAAELLRSLERDRVLSEDEQGWRLGNLDEVVPPALVVQMIERHLAALDPFAREVLETAAVLGQELVPEFWRGIAGIDEETLGGVIEQALVARIIEPYGRTDLRFRHALIREVLYQGMLFPKRRRIHRQIAEALVQSGASDPDSIAFHFRQAGDERAVDWLIRAGDRARRVYAHAVAAERFEAALQMLGDDPATDRQRAWLAWRTSRMYRWANEDKQRDYIEMAGQLAGQAGERSLLVLCSIERGVRLCGDGEGSRGIEEIAHGAALWDSLAEAERIETVSEAFAQRLDTPLDADVLADRDLMSRLSRIYPGKSQLSAWLAYVGRFSEAIASAQQLLGEVDDARLPPDLHRLSSRGTSAALAVAYAALGNPGESRDMYALVHENNRLMNAHVQRLFAAGMHFWFLNLPYYTDDLAERRTLSAIANDAVTRIDKAFPSMVSGIPWFEVVAGNWHEAKSLLYAYLKRPGGWGWRLPFLSLACWLERHTGEAELAWSRIHECLPAGPRTEPGDEQFMFITPLLRCAVELALDDADLERAHTWLNAHDRWLQWAGALTGQAEAHLLWARYRQQSGDLAAARREAELALQVASDPRQPLHMISSYRFLGELNVLDRRFNEAEQNLTQAMEIVDACELPYERARCLLALARLQAARNDSLARALIEDVRAICQPLDARLMLAEADTLEREMGDVRYPAGLSARETEVLRLIAGGLSDAQIAERLFISPRTVNRHTTSIYNKLGVNSRVAATRFAIDHQLV